MTDTIKTIRTGIETCIGDNTTFTKLDNKFDLEKNQFNNEVKRYGVVARDGSPAGQSLLRYVTIDRDFQITLCNKFISTTNGDDQQEVIGDLLENAMETITERLQSSKAGLPNLVNSINFANNDVVVYDEIENLAILRFDVIVQFRKQIINC